MQRRLNLKSVVLRLYNKQRERGWGLVRVNIEILKEMTKIQVYIRKMASTDELLSQCLILQKPEKAEEVEDGPSGKDKP